MSEPVKKRIHRTLPILIPHGEWRIEEMKIEMMSLKHARISFKKNMVNAHEHYIDVKLTWFDKRKGITLKQKLQQSYDNLKTKLEAENEELRERKRIEKSIIR